MQCRFFIHFFQRCQGHFYKLKVIFANNLMLFRNCQDKISTKLINLKYGIESNALCLSFTKIWLMLFGK